MRKRSTTVGSLLSAAALAGALTACSSPASSMSGPSVSCTNYAIHGTGKYHDEVQIRVSVSNTAPQPVTDTVDVDLTTADSAGSGIPAMHVAIAGLVAAKSSADLSRKVLSVSKVQHCQITRTSPSNRMAHLRDRAPAASAGP
jgi:hypothetical protein